MDSGMKKRCHVFISGRVQGVCFRAYTKKQADSLGLAGWVKNRANGQVESVFEGDETAVRTMLAWCRQGPPLARVKDVDVSDEPVSGTYKDFRILY
jgi:acylphosphatase